MRKKRYILVFLLFFLLGINNSCSQSIFPDKVINNASRLTEKLDNFLKLNDRQKITVQKIYEQYINDYYYLLRDEGISNNELIKRESIISERRISYIKRVLNKDQNEKYLTLLSYMED